MNAQLKKCSRADCKNPLTKNGLLPIIEFSNYSQNKDGLSGYCKHCKKKDNKKSVDRYAIEGKELKLKEIKSQKCICPGCGFDYSVCPDKALLIIFELSHVHQSKCKQRKRTGSNNYCFSIIDKYFWACVPCNRKQKGICGYWEKPLTFKLTCS